METRDSTITRPGSTGQQPVPTRRRRQPTRTLHTMPVPAWVAAAVGIAGLWIGIGLGYNVGQPTPWPAPAPVVTPLPGTPTGVPITPMSLGSTLLLGDTTGQAFTVTQVADPAVGVQPAPSPGYRYLAVKLTITNTTGSAWHSDGVPNIHSVVIDSVGRQYGSVNASTTLAPPFVADLVLPPGGSTTGAVVFQVPAADAVTGVQIALAPDVAAVGLWTIN